MPDAHANFAIASISTAPSPASTGTACTVSTGQGSRFPAVPFNASVGPNTDPLSFAAAAEIVRVTAMSGDSITAMTRAQEGTSARSIQSGDIISATITKKTLTDVEFPITSTSATAIAIGPNGATNPTFQLDLSVASAATGILITPAASGSGVTIAATGGTNENIYLVPKGTTGNVIVSLGANVGSSLYINSTLTNSAIFLYGKNGNNEGLFFAHNGTGAAVTPTAPANAIILGASYTTGGSYRPFSFATSDIQAMQISTTGKVSIGQGTGSPTYALHIAPTSGQTDLQTFWCQNATLTTGKTGGFFVAGSGQGTAAILTVHDGTNPIHQFCSARLGFFAATPAVQQTLAALTNSITSGGSANTLTDWTNLTVYATDAAAIRNAVYQLGQQVVGLQNVIKTFGLNAN